MPVHDALHQGETEPNAVVLGGGEGLEETVRLRLGHAWTGVLNCDHHLVLHPAATHANLAGGGRGLHRVGEEVVEETPQLDRAAIHLEAGDAVRREDHRLGQGDGPRSLFDDGVEFHPLLHERLVPDNVEQVADDAEVIEIDVAEADLSVPVN